MIIDRNISRALQDCEPISGYGFGEVYAAIKAYGVRCAEQAFLLTKTCGDHVDIAVNQIAHDELYPVEEKND